MLEMRRRCPYLPPQVWQELALLCASSDDHANAAFCSDQALQLCPWQARSHQVWQINMQEDTCFEDFNALSQSLTLRPDL